MSIRSILNIVFLLFISAVSSVKAQEVVATPVTVENFSRVAFDLQAVSVITKANGINNWHINKLPIFADKQPTTYVNRDMLYLLSVIDIQKGAQISAPSIQNRYMSFSVINRDGYTKKVFHGDGIHSLNREEIGTDFVYVVGRIMVDAESPKDLLMANSIQDNIRIFAGSERPFPRIDYDINTYEKLDRIFSELMLHMSTPTEMFGLKEDVNALQFLVGASIGWGGLPRKEAIYFIEKPNLPINRYKVTIRNSPIDSFWSITIYNKDGFFQNSTYGKISVDSRNAIPDNDGSITVNFGGCTENTINCLGLMRGWNYIVRIYRPDEATLSGAWTFPAPEIR